MHRKHHLVTRMLAALALTGASLSAQAVLPDGTVLQFNAGIESYDSSGSYLGVTGGSYFAVDLNGNGKFTMIERTAIAMHDGLIIGASQPAGGSHPGSVNGSEAPGIDAPWNFFGNTGMFQTLNPVIDYGDDTLDFSGIGITWNGIPNIPLGQAAYPSDTQRATLVCSNTPCLVGDTYTLDFYGHVPAGDASGFGGVWFALHLEGTITNGPVIPRIVIKVEGGNQQECTTHEGTPMTINADVTVPPGDQVATINWLLDGTSIGSGEQILPSIPLGTHNLVAEVQTLAGLSATSRRELIVRDTQQPNVTAAFVDKYSEAVVMQVSKDTKVRIRAQAEDACDPNPTVAAMVGVPVQDGGTIGLEVERGWANINVPQMTLSVNARDGSGNASSATSVLNVGN